MNDGNTEYSSLIAGVNPSTTTTTGSTTAGCPGILSSFSVTLSGNPDTDTGGGDSNDDGYSFTVMTPAGTTATLTCNIVGSSTTCTDTTGATTQAFAAGATVNVRIAPIANGTAPDNEPSATWTATYTFVGATPFQ